MDVPGVRLRVGAAFGGSLAWVGATLVAALLACELLVRLPALEVRLPPPSLGTAVPQLELLLSRAREMVARDGGIDCLFVGSSVVSCGIDPVVFGASYRAARGGPIRCFNAGQVALSAPHVDLVADLFVSRLHPRLVIFGTTARDYLPGLGPGEAPQLMSSAWVRHRLGQPSLRGWLYEHSEGYRRVASLAAWFDPASWDAARRARASRVTSEGYWPVDHVATDLDGPPGWPAERLRELSEAGTWPTAAALAGLERLLALRRGGTEVLVVEVPTHASTLAYLARGAADREAFTAAIADVVRRSGGQFWPYDGEPMPEEGWSDAGHMNRAGARVFSRRLGRQIGEAVREGRLADPSEASEQGVVGSLRLTPPKEMS